MPTLCDKNWIEHLNTVSTGYDLIGPVIEVPPNSWNGTKLEMNKPPNVPFIHTYMFGTSQKGFKNVRETLKGINGVSKEEIVHNIERKITGSILNSKLKIKSLLLRFKNVDMNDMSNWDTKKWTGKDDVSCYETPGNYFGMDLNPLEVIFVKNIRNANTTRHESQSSISNWLSTALSNYVQWN
jgi:hypothetical protein